MDGATPSDACAGQASSHPRCYQCLNGSGLLSFDPCLWLLCFVFLFFVVVVCFVSLVCFVFGCNNNLVGLVVPFLSFFFLFLRSMRVISTWSPHPPPMCIS